MRTHWFAVICAVLVLVWSAPISAKQGRGHGRGQGKAIVAKSEFKDKAKGGKRQGRSVVATTGVTSARKRALPIAGPAVVIDRDGHRRIVTEYFSRETLPPGLAKRQSLPPGLQKQLRERGHLPPGLQKRLVPVPRPLFSQLPSLPRGYSRFFAGRDLLVVDTRTNEVVALVPDVLIR